MEFPLTHFIENFFQEVLDFVTALFAFIEMIKFYVYFVLECMQWVFSDLKYLLFYEQGPLSITRYKNMRSKTTSSKLMNSSVKGTNKFLEQWMLPVFFSCCYHKTQLRNKGLILALEGVVISDGGSRRARGRNQENWSRTEVLTDSLPSACSPTFLKLPRLTFSGMVLPTEHWALHNNQKKMFIEMPTDRFDGDNSSTETPFSQATLVCVN